MSVQNKTFSSVMVNGTVQDLGQDMSVNDIKSMLESYGLGKNFENATPVEVEEGVLEFQVQRGTNG